MLNRLSAWGVSLLLVLVTAAAHAEKPNVVFILVDDQRNDTLGCAGHPVIQSPNIDRLADRGVRFTNMFVNTPICMASRANIFLGLTTTAHGYPGSGGRHVIDRHLDASFPILLRDAGYRTGFFGKQHVKFQAGNNQAMRRMFDAHEIIHRNPYFKKQPDGTLRHTADLIGDRSVSFIETQGDEPFCLYMSFNIGHAEDSDHRPGVGHFPWPPSVDGMYEDVDPAPPALGDPAYYDVNPAFLRDSLNRVRWYWRWDTLEKYQVNMRAYYRMITGMDLVIGRVQAALEAKGVADNTIIIYTADNGFYMGDRGFAGKWSHYEQSLRVPLIVFDPRLPEPKRGRVLDDFAVNLDLPSTILDAAGVAIPDHYQGRSLLPLVRDETPSGWRDAVYCEHHYQHPEIPKWRGVRGERYTYAVYFEQDPPYEFLHDLQRDPTQFQNLADDPAHGEILKQMRERTEAFYQKYREAY